MAGNTAVASERTVGAGPRTLEDLARLGVRELDALYRGAKTPRVEDLAGPLRGRMLAVPGLSRVPVASGLLRAFARSAAFPWRGKSFTTLSAGKGEGMNRVFSDRWSWYRFATSVGRSHAGEFDAVHLDYDNPGNPFFIRAIRDEVREVAPGLWLGLAFLRTGRTGRERYRLAVYFALASAAT